MGEINAKVSASAPPDSVERQKRLGKNIVRLAAVLSIPYLIAGLLSLPDFGVGVVFFLSIGVFLVFIPRLMRTNKLRLLMLLMVPVLIFVVDFFDTQSVGFAFVFAIVTVPIGGTILLGMIVVYLSRRSKLARGVESKTNDGTAM